MAGPCQRHPQSGALASQPQLQGSCRRLQAIGVKDNERNISNKISRGTFTAVFFVQCLDAIGCHTVHFNED